MITIDSTDIARLERDLATFRRSALGAATRDAVNAQAFAGKRLWGREVKRKMIQRNKFTAGAAIRVERARGGRVDRLEAVLGSIAEYMDDQEFGATQQKRGRLGKPIPSRVAAGQAMGSAPRTRAVRRPNWLQNIQLKGKRRSRGGKRQNVIAIKEAASSGRPYAYLDLGPRSRGIYKITGSPERAKIRMVWNLSQPSVRIPATPTLGPATKAVAKRSPGLYRAALLSQVQRQGIFRPR